MESVNTEKETPKSSTNEDMLSTFKDVGKTLALTRKEKKLTIPQIASKVHIRQKYLKDIEEGSFQNLPGHVYTLGFIRTYAHFLNLDANELVRRINAASQRPIYTCNYIPLSPLPDKEPNSRILVFAVILILLSGIVGYFFFKSPSQEFPTTLTISENKVSAPLEKSLLPENFFETKSLSIPEQAAEEKKISEQTMPLPAESSSSKSENVATESAKIITVKAEHPSWVEIRDETGKVLFMKVLQKDEEYTAPQKTGIILNTGNAGGITLLVNNKKQPSLGSIGEVKRNIALDALE